MNLLGLFDKVLSKTFMMKLMRLMGLKSPGFLGLGTLGMRVMNDELRPMGRDLTIETPGRDLEILI